MRRQQATAAIVALAFTGLLNISYSSAIAQTAPTSYQADPDVYKVIYEDQYFRVIASTRKKGVHDKVHSHPVPAVTYLLTDCVTRYYAPDGKTSDDTAKAGTASTVTVTPSHSAENIGTADCQAIFVERK